MIRVDITMWTKTLWARRTK